MFRFLVALLLVSALPAAAVPINVGNFVWEDIDGDGVQDAGEPGMAGVIVQLWNGDKTNMHDSATTDASGFYSLIAPGPGQYRVRVLLPSNAFPFSPKDKDDDSLDSDIHPDGALWGFTDTLVVGSAPGLDTRVDAGLAGLRVFADGFE
ncbi:MAG: SdrD B-like domain-containing protein [Lysobacteraceae bacterium]